MYRRKVIYDPRYIAGFSAAMLCARHDLARLREDWLLEAAMIREEVRMAKAELRRLQQLDVALNTERDPAALLQ